MERQISESRTIVSIKPMSYWLAHKVLNIKVGIKVKLSKKRKNLPIGGEFSLPLSSSKISLHLPLDALPSSTSTTSGRDAVRAVIKNWAGRNTIILSAYTCDSVLSALKLETEFSSHLIDISPNFYPNFEELNSMTTVRLSESILIIGSLFGIPYPATFKNMIDELQAKGLVIVEDRTHNLFSPQLWLNANGWFASGRKWIPSAGLGIYSPRPYAKNNILNFIRVSCLLFQRSILMRVLHYVILFKALRNRVVNELRRTDNHLGLREHITFSFGGHHWRKLGQNLNGVDHRRWEKTEFIIDRLKNIDGIEILNHLPEPTSSPFNVTLRVAERRDELRAYLALKEIFLPVLWSMPENFADKYPNSWGLSREVLSIPVDHRYELGHLEIVCNEISNFQSRN